VVASIVGALAIAGTTALGFWQLRRAAGKEVLQHEVEEAARAVPSKPDADALSHVDALIHKHVALRGRWLSERVVYLDNRPQAGRAGLYVLMPLHIEEPVAADVIVNRGWLPRDAVDRARIAPYRTPEGEVAVTGVVLAEEPRLLELGNQSDRTLGGIWQNFDFDTYARASGREPLRIVVRQDGADPSDGLDRNWPDRGGALQAQIDRHHGYAFQWFAMAATLAALLIYQLFRAMTHARKHIV
jgi:surfeit locus 1 family protein